MWQNDISFHFFFQSLILNRVMYLIALEIYDLLCNNLTKNKVALILKFRNQS